MDRTRLSSLLGIVFVLCIAFPAMAQFDLVVIPQVLPPYSANYADYFSDPSQVQIIINNTSGETKNIYLAGSITSQSQAISVSVSGNSPWGAPPLQVNNGANLYNGNDLQPALQMGGGNVEYEGITEAQLALGILPEGNYILCLRAYDHTTGEQLSDGELGCSNPFTILTAQPPTLNSPPCEENVVANAAQQIQFAWILPQGPPGGAIVNYNFRLVRIWDAINAQSALETSTDLVYEETTSIPVLLYNQTMPVLIAGQQYAWWVQATTLFNDVLFENQGYSAPCTFTYTNESTEPFQFVYPYQQDTLPWVHLPVIVHYEPHPDTTGAFHSTLTRIRNGSETATFYRQTQSDWIKWNSGPFLSQEYLLHQVFPQAPFTRDMAQYINVYKSVPTPGDVFVHGSEYELSAYLKVARYNLSQPVDGDVSGRFVSGMGMPVPMSPPQGAVFNLPEEEDPEYPVVTLHFQTAAPPVHFFPPYPIYIIEGGVPSQTYGSMNEKWRLRLSRSADMSDPILTKNGSVGHGLNVNTGTHADQSVCSDQQCAIDAVYKEITVDYTPSDTGWYYWQIGWLQDTTNLAGSTYHDCGIRRFRISGNAPPQVTTTDDDEVPPAECLANCRRTPTVDRTPVSTTAIGDTVQVGLFKMLVQTITNSGGFASGTGLIDVPVMRAKLRVGFTGVQINANKRLYHGTVKGLYDNVGIIPSAYTQGSALAVGFNPKAAQDLDDYLNTAGRLVSQFAGNSPMGLPIGIDKKVPGGRFVIGILATDFTDTIAHLNAGMALPIHDVGSTVGLGNMSIPFHPGGIGDVSEEGTLYLLGDINIPIGEDSLRINGTEFSGGFTTVQDSGTFVAWDCHGFRALTIDAEYRFSPENLKEDLANGDDGPTKVVGAIRVRTGRGGFMGRVDLNKPFHLTNAKGWGFDVQEAWLDLASYDNPPGLTEAVQEIGAANHALGTATQVPAWTGLLVKRTMMRMPNEIERIDGPGRVTAQVDNLIYSFGQGVSAQIKLANIIGTDQGKLDGWGFSMDTLQVDIISNAFSQGGFKGMIHVPCTDTLLAYSAMIQHDILNEDVRIEFLLHPDGILNIPMVVGTLALQETSTVRAVFGDATLGTYAKAELNGTLDITADLSDIGEVDFKLIKFEHLTFQTKDPYTNADGDDVFSLASPQKFMGGSPLDDTDPPADGPTQPGKAGGFPVSITRVTMERRNPSGTPLAGIAFDLNLNLTGETNIFTATTRFAILGELNTSSIHEWNHHKVELDSIGISGNTGAVRIHGGLRWYRGDAVYGDGIMGTLDAGFMKDKIQVKAAAQFGTKGTLKYWYVDAMGAWQNGISPGSAFNVYGFGGGAWYHMKRTSPLPSALEITVGEILNQDDDDYEPGLTLSKVTMVPDAATSYGFQATVVFGDGASGRAYNGDLTAGMTLSSTGGVNTVFLNGSVYLLSERDDREYVPVHGTAAISFDFPNDVFSANFEMFVDVAHGLVVGSHTNNLAGSANILITPDTWHFLVGQPATPIGLKFAGFIKGDFYFMVGKNLPQRLPPPAEITSILPANFYAPQDFPNADGIAFGARVAMNDTVKFFLFKLTMNAAIGFDIAFHEVGDMECAGIDDPGIQGWYATGQLYGYVHGALSLYIDLWVFEGEKHLVDITAAAVMHGEFANPSWARGYLYASYSVLSGAVSGSVDFEFNLGDPCITPEGGVLAGLDPIGDLTPHDQAGMTTASLKVDCGVQPEAAFNMAIGPEMDLTETDANGNRKVRTIRLVLDKFEVRKYSPTTLINADMTIATNKIDATLHPYAYLTPNTTYTVEVVVKAEELKNGQWGPGYKPGTTTQVKWTKKNTFKTDAGIQELRAQDIDYTYPFTNQRFLLQDECRAGVIQCRARLDGMPLFKSPYGRRRIFKAMFTSVTGGATITKDVTVEHGSNKTWIRFDIPTIVNLRTYKMLLVARDEFDASNLVFSDGGGSSGGTSTSPFSGSNIMQATAVTSSYQSAFNNMVNIRKRTISGYTLSSNEKRIYDFHFRTSQYNTIEAKVTALQNTGTDLNAPSGYQTLTPSFSGEKFDVFDVNPLSFTNGSVGPLVKLLDPHTDIWYTSYVKPVMFDYYNALKTFGCTTNELTPMPNTLTWHTTVQPAQPLTAAEASPSPYGQALTGGYVVSIGGAEPIPLPPVRLFNVTPQFAYWNYFQLCGMAIEAEANCNNPGDDVGNMGGQLLIMHDRFLNTPYKVLYKGSYGARFTFIAPTCAPDMIDWSEEEVDVSRVIKLYQNTSGPAIPPNLLYSSPTVLGTGGIQVVRP